MDSNSHQDLVRQILFCLIDKASYLKELDSTINKIDESYFQGQVIAYHQILDAVFEIILLNGWKLENFGIEDFNPNEVLDYRHKG